MPQLEQTQLGTDHIFMCEIHDNWSSHEVHLTRYRLHKESTISTCFSG